MEILKRINLVRLSGFAYEQEASGGTMGTINADQSGNIFVIPAARGPAGGDPFAINQVQLSVDNQSTLLRGLSNLSALHIYDPVGDNWDRQRAIPDDADTQASLGIGTAGIIARLQAWNGATFDRLRAISAAVQASFAAHVGIQAVALAGNWSIQNDPAVNVQATIARAAGAAGVRHVCTSIFASFSAGATAGAAVKVYLRDGLTGAGAILWSGSLAVAIGGTANIALSGLSIVGSAATAMTLEFAAAGGVTTFENVSLTGYTVA